MSSHHGRMLMFAVMLFGVKHLLCVFADRADAVLFSVAPHRLQFFEYETVTLFCEGSADFTDWRIMKKHKGGNPTCVFNFNTSERAHVIQNVFEGDSGEYWCEANGEMRSNSVNISVTAGLVILESSAHPWIEGENVTLSCTNKSTSSDLIADFYKDGNPSDIGYRGHMTIYNVSKSDEGLYKCQISGLSESPESWLAVRAPEKTHLVKRPLTSVLSMWTLCLVAGPLLLLLLLFGVCLFRRHGVLLCVWSKTSTSRSGGTETVAGFSSDYQPQGALYSQITPHSFQTGESIFTDEPPQAECEFYQTVH